MSQERIRQNIKYTKLIVITISFYYHSFNDTKCLFQDYALKCYNVMFFKKALKNNKMYEKND